jgi:hypothetical protein
MTEQDQDESADAAGDRGDDRCAGAIAWRNAWLKAIDAMALAFEKGMDRRALGDPP